jgi:hypothetical protein
VTNSRTTMRLVSVLIFICLVCDCWMDQRRNFSLTHWRAWLNPSFNSLQAFFKDGFTLSHIIANYATRGSGPDQRGVSPTVNKKDAPLMTRKRTLQFSNRLPAIQPRIIKLPACTQRISGALVSGNYPIDSAGQLSDNQMGLINRAD